MNTGANAERLIAELGPEIDRRCEELRAARRERLRTRLFVLLCAAVLLIPSLLVICGASLAALLVPIAFMSLSVVLLLPTLLSGRAAEQGDVVYDKT